MYDLRTIKELNTAAAARVAEKRAAADHTPVKLTYERVIDNTDGLPGFIAVYAEGWDRYEATIDGRSKRFDTFAAASAWRKLIAESLPNRD